MAVCRAPVGGIIPLIGLFRQHPYLLVTLPAIKVADFIAHVGAHKNKKGFYVK
jgi:hypothetical protein